MARQLSDSARSTLREMQRGERTEHLIYTGIAKFVKKEAKPRTQKIEMDKDMKGFSISTSDDYGYSSFSFHSTDEDLVQAMLKKYEKF